MDDDVVHLLAHQSGVVSRRQLLDLGVSPASLRRMIRRRDLTRVLPGVFLDHTGAPTWTQRAWVGCLYLWPAALAGESALRAAAGPGYSGSDDSAPLTLAVPMDRHTRPPRGYRLVRPVHFPGSVLWNARPPRLRTDVAALDAAARADTDLQVVGILADVVQARLTTPARLLANLGRRRRIRRRPWLRAVLGDLATGACSTLEVGYAARVARAHGLPLGRRQAPGGRPGARVYRDVELLGGRLLVELDGRVFHDSAGARDRDLDRDLDAAVEDRFTLRLGWGQVFDRSCRTAGRLASVMRRLGWAGAPTTCGPGCTVKDDW